MPVVPRVTFEYKSLNTGYGWSETLWPFQVADLKGALVLATTYIGARVRLLAENVICTDIRASDDLILRDSLLGNPPDPQVAPSGGRYYDADWIGVPAAPVDVAVNIRLEAGEKYRGPLFLSGIPGTVATALSNELPPPPVWNKKLAGFLKILGTVGLPGWGIKVLNKPGDGPAPTPIQNIVTNGVVITVTSAGHGLANGDRIRITGVQTTGVRFSVSNLSVANVQANTFTVEGYKRSLAFGYVGGGTVQKLVPFVAAITNSIENGVTHRKRGRPFGLRRGKARTR